MTDDTIYRQAAIDAICKACSMEGDYHKCDGYPETSTWCDELVALRALPSAQPQQIVRCKDCKHNPKLEWFGCPMSHLNEKQRPETAWCWKGERKDDE